MTAQAGGAGGPGGAAGGVGGPGGPGGGGPKCGAAMTARPWQGFAATAGLAARMARRWATELAHWPGQTLACGPGQSGNALLAARMAVAAAFDATRARAQATGRARRAWDCTIYSL